MKKRIVFLLICLFVYRGISASYSLYNLENLNNQISNRAVLCMHQDKYGFMWFGTYDGLNLYNGKEVITFRFQSDNSHSLSGNTIHNIISCDDSHLWIATQLGLNKFNLKERVVDESYPEYKKVDLITNDSKGNTWLINRDHVISYYDVQEKKFREIQLKGTFREDVKSLFLDKEGRLCLVKKNGILQYVTMETDPVKKNYSLFVKDIDFHDKEIRQAFYEKDQIYFIDQELNLFVYDDSKQHKILIRNISGIISKYGLISSLSFFQNEIYMAFMHSGLVKFNVSNHDQPELVNMEIGIFGLMRDRYQDALWVGTDGQGVGLYYSEKDKFGNILLSNLPFTAKRPIRAFYTDSENALWIGTKGDGIIRIKDYDKFSNGRIPAANIQHLVTHEGLYENPVYCFIRSKFNTDDLWIGTDGNISYYSYRDKQIHVVEDNPDIGPLLTNVHTLCEINDSTLWVSSKGLYEVTIDKTKKPYRIKRKNSYTFQKDGNDISDEYYSMVYDGKGYIFIGSRRGYGTIRLNIHDKKYHFVSMAKADIRAIGDVISLHMNKDSVLYIGASSGLTQIKMFRDKENAIKQFNRNDNIINDMIHGILEDNMGIIWLSTNKGLVKYNPQNDSFFNVKSSQIGVVEYSDDAYWRCPITGRLFFGGVNGLTWIEPKNGKEMPAYEPKLLFTDFTHFGQVQTLYDHNEDHLRKLKLPAGKNTFQIAFAVLDYINGDNYDYSYQLENYHTHWVSLQKENKINFINLPPGDYVLKVKYKNDVVNGDNKIFSLPIIILPPWYLSTIAYVSYLLLMILCISSIIYYIRWKFHQKQSVVARRIKEEQREKLYESKLRFFTNVTHELYTPLTLINGALEQIKKEEGKDVNSRLKKYFGILQNNVISLNELIQEILDYRKIEESEINPYTLKNVSVTHLVDNLLTSYAELALQNRIELIASVPDDLYWSTDRASFKKIVSNLLSNAFKYTPVGGTIRVNISITKGSLKIEVYNTGRGIEPDKLKTVFNRYHILENADVNANNQMTARNGLGLFICQSMTQLLQGEISVESEVNEYVRFTVLLPDLTGQFKEPEEKPVIEKKPDIPEEVNFNKTEDNSEIYVLVVDDNQEIVEMVGDILSPYYTILKAFSAQEALNIMKKQTPDLVITDIMMPEIDGLSFIHMIRKNKYNKHLPVIALSARVEDRDHVKGYDAGADAYIAKPFSSEVLVSIVHRFLANKEEIKNYYDSAESVFEFTHGKLLHQEDKEFTDQVLAIVKENLTNEDLRAEFVAEKMGISTRALYRQLKRILDVTPTEFIKDFRFSYAAKLLISTNLSVKEIVYRIGITNKSYFYNEFQKKFNAPPKQYKSMHQGGVLDE